ncbi:MAG: hypothetical protein QNJ22_19400 [Desulfosarcinaceae bacterium]|nr:hypothetical protein [Desulfosarcinaceae bacterium]
MAIGECHLRSDTRVVDPCRLGHLNDQVDATIGCEHYCYDCHLREQARTEWREEIFTHAN